jgi:chromatin segregation and condensation protein Rec8/ScpA/Scc1 (kleisin family)
MSEREPEREPERELSPKPRPEPREPVVEISAGPDDPRYVPCNIDGYSEDAEEFWQLGEVYDKLARYTRLRCMAKRQREQGGIEKALRMEAQMEAIYKLLPEWAKW